MQMDFLEIGQFLTLIAEGHTPDAAASEFDLTGDEVMQEITDGGYERDYKIARNKAKLKFEKRVYDKGTPAQILQVLQIFNQDDWSKPTNSRSGGNNGNGRLREEVGELEFDPPVYLGGRFAQPDPEFQPSMLDGLELD